MVYKVNIEKKAAKILAKIDEPNYSHIKAAILNLAINPRPAGYEKLKGEMVTGYVPAIAG
jgi:mRNA interferase RelE/StbE